MKKDMLVLFGFLLVLSTNLYSQNRPFGTGLNFDDEIYSAQPVLPDYSGSKYNKIPLVKSLKKFCPIPKSQGSTGSCVGWSTCYAGLTIARAIKENNTDRAIITKGANSPYFVYNQIKLGQDCERGARISDALILMKNQGDCLFPTLDVCNISPTIDAKIEAQNYKIKGFGAVFRIEDSPAKRIKKIQKVLAANNPVIVGVNLTESFWKIRRGDKVWNPQVGELGIGGHAMTVVGYNLVKKTFEIMNSWGPYWGNEGFIEVPFDDFARYCKYGYFMILEDDVQTITYNEKTPVTQEKKQVNLAGQFALRYPNGYRTAEDGTETIDFKEAQVIYNPSTKSYKTTRANWNVGDVFQLVAKNIPKGKFAYIFSVDPQNKVELHWPIEEERMNKVNLSQLIPSSNAEILVPGEDDALQLAESGEDNLVILFSNQQIDDIQQRISSMSRLSGSVWDKINQTFSKELIPTNKINYDRQIMNFKTTFEKGDRFIVPIVLTVNAL